jgi:hypothetical protein
LQELRRSMKKAPQKKRQVSGGDLFHIPVGRRKGMGKAGGK